MKNNLFLWGTVVWFIVFATSGFTDPISEYENYLNRNLSQLHVITSETDALHLAQMMEYNPSEVEVTRQFTPVSGKDTPAMSVRLTADPRYTADLYILPGVGDNDVLSKPLVIGDAFDPKNDRGIEQVLASDQYNNLVRAGTYRRVTIHNITCFSTEGSFSRDKILLSVQVDNKKAFNVTQFGMDSYDGHNTDYIRVINRSISMQYGQTVTIKLKDIDLLDGNDDLGTLTIDQNTPLRKFYEDLESFKGWNNVSPYHYGITYSVEDVDPAQEALNYPYLPGRKRIDIHRLVVHQQEDATGDDDVRITMHADGIQVYRNSRQMDDLDEMLSEDGEHIWTLNQSYQFSTSFSLNIMELDLDFDDNLGTMNLDISTPTQKNCSYDFQESGAYYTLYYSVTDLGTNRQFTAPREMGYDVFFIDFAQGGGDIRKNAKLMMKVLQQVEHCAQPYVVGGISMSGIVGRLALLYSLPANNTTNTTLLNKVKGFLTIDSPHQGASIGQLQKQLWSILAQDPIINEVSKQIQKTYAQLNVPAAHQMLYGHHYYNPTNVMKESEVHSNFYTMLRNMGDYRNDFPLVSIATSNFFNPNQNLDKQVVNDVQRLQIDIAAGASYSKTLKAGGSEDYQKFELFPGSIGDWYYNIYDFGQGSAEHMISLTGTEKFKGTFIPLHSALDLRGFDVLNPALDRSMENLRLYSPFDRTLYLDKEFNEYRNDYSVNGKRYHHIFFDYQVIQKLQSGLEYIEQKYQERVTAMDGGLPRTRIGVNGNFGYRITGLPLYPAPASYTIEVTSGDGSQLNGISATISEKTFALAGRKSLIHVQNIGQNEILVLFNSLQRRVRLTWYPNYMYVPVYTEQGLRMEGLGVDVNKSIDMSYINMLLLNASARQVVTDAGLPYTFKSFTTNSPYFYRLTNFPTDYTPTTITIQLQATDGRVLSGTALAGGNSYELSGWNYTIRIPYAGQSQIYTKITAEAGREFQVQWWADMSDAPASGSENDPPPATPPTGGGSSSGTVADEINTFTAFDVNGSVTVTLQNFPNSWTPNEIVAQIQPDDGSAMSGTATVNGNSHVLDGWSQDMHILYSGQQSIDIDIQADQLRRYKIQWWAQ